MSPSTSAAGKTNIQPVLSQFFKPSPPNAISPSLDDDHFGPPAAAIGDERWGQTAVGE